MSQTTGDESQDEDGGGGGGGGGGEGGGGADAGTAAESPTGSLRVEGLSAGYGELRIVEGVDLRVDAGEFVAIIGPNGAGKSTLLRSLFGLADRDGGRIAFDGESVEDASTVELVERGMGLVPQEANVFPDLTVMENLRMGAYTTGDLSEETLSRVYDRFPILAERTDQLAGTLSGGQRQMLAISRALVTDPDLLVLDEPSAGLAPDLVLDLFEEIEAINADGTSVLVVEQNAEEILKRADRAYVLTQGQIRREAPAETLLNDETVREEFLGG
jgi:branched-chain amino acid transport system ATP-binding protein